MITGEGGTLKKAEANTDEPTECYVYQDKEQQIQYEFTIYEEKLSVLWENQLDK